MTLEQLQRFPIAAAAIGLSERDSDNYARQLTRPGTGLTSLSAVAIATRMKARAAGW